jgi:short subunit dehydrogenase-like uncharacterized protein
VHRSNFLLEHAWGTDLVYDEMLVTGTGDKGQAIAEAVAADKSLGGEGGPKPGEGPSRAERDAGLYDVMFIGSNEGNADTLTVGVKGDRDPGYGSTSKMIAESAMCLLLDAGATKGGIWTPAAAMGHALVVRLEAYAGLRFTIEN